MGMRSPRARERMCGLGSPPGTPRRSAGWAPKLPHAAHKGWQGLRTPPCTPAPHAGGPHAAWPPGALSPPCPLSRTWHHLAQWGHTPRSRGQCQGRPGGRVELGRIIWLRGAGWKSWGPESWGSFSSELDQASGPTGGPPLLPTGQGSRPPETSQGRGRPGSAHVTDAFLLGRLRRSGWPAFHLDPSTFPPWVGRGEAAQAPPLPLQRVQHPPCTRPFVGPIGLPIQQPWSHTGQPGRGSGTRPGRPPRARVACELVQCCPPLHHATGLPLPRFPSGAARTIGPWVAVGRGPRVLLSWALSSKCQQEDG